MPRMPDVPCPRCKGEGVVPVMGTRPMKQYETPDGSQIKLLGVTYKACPQCEGAGRYEP